MVGASKLQEKLLNDPEWVARRKAQDEHFRQKPVLDELRQVGINYDSLGAMLVSPCP